MLFSSLRMQSVSALSDALFCTLIVGCLFKVKLFHQVVYSILIGMFVRQLQLLGFRQVLCVLSMLPLG